MNQIILQHNDKTYYEAYVEEDSNYLYSNWIGFVSEGNIRKAATEGLILLEKNKCACIINDNTEMMGPWNKSNEWIAKEWTPRAIKAGLKYMAHIVAPNVFGKISAQDLIQKIDGFEMRLFNTKDEAQEWIDSTQESSTSKA